MRDQTDIKFYYPSLLELLAMRRELLLKQLGASVADQIRSRELMAISTAVERIRHGSYGSCLFCEEEIPLERLLNLPHAALCLDCQSFEESENAKNVMLRREISLQE